MKINKIPSLTRQISDNQITERADVPD